MKKIFLILFFFLFLFPFSVQALEFDLYSENAILYNLNEDSVLYEKGSKEEVSIASLTKIVTAIVALENISNLDEKVTLTYADFAGLAEQNASVAGFRVGEVVTYRDLLYGLLLPSGADAALALTRNIAGSNDAFVSLMNKKVQELGLSHTHFVNPTGLDSEGHYSTVEEVATILKYSIQNKEFLEIIKTPTYTTSNGRLTFRSTISKALTNYNLSMDYLIGGKTGTTGDAGLCLASIATYNNVNYLLVTVRAPYSKTTPGNYLDAKTLYEYFMNHYSYQNVLKKGDLLVTIDTEYAKKDKVEFLASNDLEMYLENTYDKEKLVYNYTGKELITLDMDKGDKLGRVDVYYNEELLTSVDIVLDEKQELDLGKYLIAHKLLVIIPSISLFFLIFIIVLILKNRKRKVKWT